MKRSQDNEDRPELARKSSFKITRPEVSEISDKTATNHSSYSGVSHRSGIDNDNLMANYRGSPYNEMDGTKHSIIRRFSDTNSQQSTHSSNDSLEDDDQPLDMSYKKYRNQDSCESQSSCSDSKSDSTVVSKSPTNSSSLAQLFSQQMMRPSVITHGSSLMKTQQIKSISPSPPSYAEAVSPTSKYHKCCINDVLNAKSGHNSSDSCNSEDINDSSYRRHSTRRLVISDEVNDPVIEEHFRRSLGKDYQQIFNNNSTNNSITYSVDDHFAKALGDTWTKLQKADTDGSQQNNAQSIVS
ncbi:transcription cofactor vestigial-like protein 4 isoform X1 [Oppia nitens]|uniref:transcription cofactor vestigial-like protein 4 isoform X1 n=1 Tax=Oppia nitens TaxID=1686743 RepID=UPI0023DAE1FA|nr:transcription cofactor vestigial-like protein 4 isoform X1 [Oppia nitens]